MKLSQKRPHDETLDPWMPWFDRMFGFVLWAESESSARRLASEEAGDEGASAWLSPQNSSCVELLAACSEGVVMRDYNPTRLGAQRDPWGSVRSDPGSLTPHAPRRVGTAQVIR